MENVNHNNQKPIIREPARENVADSRLKAREAELLARHDAFDGSLVIDKFAIDDNIVPEGWQYGWKTQSLVGQEQRENITELVNAGWEFVPASRHPGMMPAGYTGNIVRGGMVLMEIPKSVYNRFVEHREGAAKKLMVDQDEQLGTNFQSSKAPITKALGDAIPEM